MIQAIICFESFATESSYYLYTNTMNVNANDGHQKEKGDHEEEV